MLVKVAAVGRVVLVAVVAPEKAAAEQAKVGVAARATVRRVVGQAPLGILLAVAGEMLRPPSHKQLSVGAS